MDKTTRRLRYIAKYSLFFIIVFMLYILGQAPGFLSFFGIKPVFTIPFCVALAMLLDEWQVYIIFIEAGLLTDLGSMRVAGYFTLMLMAGCALVMIATKFFFKASWENCFFTCLAVMTVMLGLDFFFGYVMSGYSGLFGLFVRKVVLTSVYSSAFAIPFYHLIDNINLIRKLRVSER